MKATNPGAQGALSSQSIIATIKGAHRCDSDGFDVDQIYQSNEHFLFLGHTFGKPAWPPTKQTRALERLAAQPQTSVLIVWYAADHEPSHRMWLGQTTIEPCDFGSLSAEMRNWERFTASQQAF